MKRCLVCSLLLFLSVHLARADEDLTLVGDGHNVPGVVVIIDRAQLHANEILDWAQLGPAPWKYVPNGTTAYTSRGTAVTVTEPPLYPAYSDDGGISSYRNPCGPAGCLQEGGFTRLDGDWYGGFTSGDHLLYNLGFSYTVTLTFGRPVRGFGTQLDGDPTEDLAMFYGGPISINEAVFSRDRQLASFDIVSTTSYGGEDSAPFFGARSSTPNITSVRYTLQSWEEGLVMNEVLVAGPTAIPEPPLVALFGITFIGIISSVYTRFRRRELRHSREVSEH